jgi:hypothetical protein
MKLLTFTLRFTFGVLALLWVHLWKWCYPQASNVIDELVRNDTDLPGNGTSSRRWITLALNLPSIARAQHSAETSPSTKTTGTDSSSIVESRWKGSLRESIIWTVAAGWLLIGVTITMSFAQTGDFLFEYGPHSGREEVVTPYFKLVAISMSIQLTTIGTGLLALRIPR